jgi:2,3-bisphosphoglycerate-independent phosphoglycerate mutase
LPAQRGNERKINTHYLRIINFKRSDQWTNEGEVKRKERGMADLEKVLKKKLLRLDLVVPLAPLQDHSTFVRWTINESDSGHHSTPRVKLSKRSARRRTWCC